MKRYIAGLASSHGVRSALLMTAGNMSATVLSAVAMILFSRILGPADFGIFSVLFSLMLILSKIGDFGINVAVQREIAQHKQDTKVVTSTIESGSYLKMLIILVLAMIGVVGGKWIGINLLKIGIYSDLTAWVFILSGTVIFYEYCNTVLQGLQYFGSSLLTNFVQSGGKLLGAIVFYSVGLSVRGVTFVYLLLPALGALIGFAKIRTISFAPRLQYGAAKKILSVAKWTSLAILSATIADNLDILLVQNYLSSCDTGLWSAAVRIAMFASLVSWSLGTVLNVRVASYQAKANLRTYLKKAAVLSTVSFVGITALSVLSSPAITYSVGSEFLGAVQALNLVLISTAVLTATTPFVALFYVFDKPAYFAISGVLGTIFLLGCDILLIPHYGIAGAGYARIISRAIVLVFTLYYARQAYVEKYAPR